MNRREKIMAAAVGGLLVVFVGLYGWRTVSTWITLREGRVESLTTQLSEENFEIELGNRAITKIGEFEQRSLPADVDVARSVYQQKLLEIATALQLSEIEVSALSVGRGGNDSQELSFKLRGQGDLRQATRLLYQIYQSHNLQRVRYLSLKPLRESKQLDIDLTIEALVLAGAPRTKKLSEEVDPQFAHVTVEKYLDSIVGRNLFARENNPPQIANTRETTYPGESVTVELKASDADELDSLRYSLTESPPEGASIDPETGTFRWKASEKGEHLFQVMVTDDGLPAKSSLAEVLVAVTDRPPEPDPPEPKEPEPVKPDENVLNTFVTAITGAGGTSRVWFSVRTTGETLKIELGEKFKVGNYNAEVKHIGSDSIEVLAEGRHLLLALGDSFADAVEIPAEGL